MQYMLADNFDAFEKGAPFHQRFRELLGNGIFNADGNRTSLPSLVVGRGVFVRHMCACIGIE